MSESILPDSTPRAASSATLGDVEFYGQAIPVSAAGLPQDEVSSVFRIAQAIAVARAAADAAAASRDELLRKAVIQLVTSAPLPSEGENGEVRYLAEMRRQYRRVAGSWVMQQLASASGTPSSLTALHGTTLRIYSQDGSTYASVDLSGLGSATGDETGHHPIVVLDGGGSLDNPLAISGDTGADGDLGFTHVSTSQRNFLGLFVSLKRDGVWIREQLALGKNLNGFLDGEFIILSSGAAGGYVENGGVAAFGRAGTTNRLMLNTPTGEMMRRLEQAFPWVFETTFTGGENGDVAFLYTDENRVSIARKAGDEWPAPTELATISAVDTKDATLKASLLPLDADIPTDPDDASTTKAASQRAVSKRFDELDGRERTARLYQAPITVLGVNATGGTTGETIAGIIVGAAASSDPNHAYYVGRQAAVLADGFVNDDHVTIFPFNDRQNINKGVLVLKLDRKVTSLRRLRFYTARSAVDAPSCHSVSAYDMHVRHRIPTGSIQYIAYATALEKAIAIKAMSATTVEKLKDVYFAIRESAANPAEDEILMWGDATTRSEGGFVVAVEADYNEILSN